MGNNFTNVNVLKSKVPMYLEYKNPLKLHVLDKNSIVDDIKIYESYQKNILSQTHIILNENTIEDTTIKTIEKKWIFRIYPPGTIFHIYNEKQENYIKIPKIQDNEDIKSEDIKSEDKDKVYIVDKIYSLTFPQFTSNKDYEREVDLTEINNFDDYFIFIKETRGIYL